MSPEKSKKMRPPLWTWRSSPLNPWLSATSLGCTRRRRARANYAANQAKLDRHFGRTAPRDLLPRPIPMRRAASAGRMSFGDKFTTRQSLGARTQEVGFGTTAARSRGTMAVPCFVVTESCGKLPLWAACAKDQLSTGAQSFARQHSSGYQSCASADVTRLGTLELAVRMRHAPARDR